MQIMAMMKMIIVMRIYMLCTYTRQTVHLPPPKFVLTTMAVVRSQDTAVVNGKLSAVLRNILLRLVRTGVFDNGFVVDLGAQRVHVYVGRGGCSCGIATRTSTVTPKI